MMVAVVQHQMAEAAAVVAQELLAEMVLLL